jgi:hypothetical protein
VATSFLKLPSRHAFNHPNLWLEYNILISGHHFIPYSKEVVQTSEGEVTERISTLELAVSM